MTRQLSMNDTRIFNDSQIGLVTLVLNCLIPSHKNHPGAGDPWVIDQIDNAISKSPNLKPIFLKGLLEIEVSSNQSYKSEFRSLTQQQRIKILRTVELDHPRFFSLLLEYTYKAYYSNPRIIELLGYGATPPQPIGYTLPPFESDMLNKVKRRRKIYRSP